MIRHAIIRALPPHRHELVVGRAGHGEEERHMMAPYRYVNLEALAASPVLYLVHGEAGREVVQEILDCGHPGQLRERRNRLPRRRRCHRCASIRLVPRPGSAPSPGPSVGGPGDGGGEVDRAP